MAVDSTNYYAGFNVWELAELESITYEHSSYPAAHLIDGSLKTRTIKPLSTNPLDIVYDLNKTDLTSAIYGAGFFISNYTTDHSNSGSATFSVAFSSDNSSYDAAVISQAITSTLTPVRIFDVSVAVAPKRYVKFTFTGGNTNMYIGQLFLGRKISLGAPELEGTEPKDYYNIIAGGRGPASGRRSTAMLRDGVQSYNRIYVLSSLTNFNLLFDEARGTRELIVMQDVVNSTNQTPVVVKLTADRYEPVRLGSGIYKVQLPLQAEPYFTPGYVY